MPTIFSHAIAGIAAGQWLRPQNPDPGAPIPDSGRFLFWTAVCAMLPDADVIGFSLGIPYDAMVGHRGLTHSIMFAAVVGVAAASQIPNAKSQTPNPNSSTRNRNLKMFLWFFAVTASHGLLDAMTNGGRGIAFFAPFSDHRYFFPWRPIEVSPIGAGFFSARGLRVLACEARWILVPSAIIGASARLMRRT